MANIKSQIKRNRQNEKRRLNNRTARGSARSAVRDARGAMAVGEDSKTAVIAAISSLDVAARNGAIHPKNAARRKSRLMKAMNKAIANPVKPVEKKTSAKKSGAKK